MPDPTPEERQKLYRLAGMGVEFAAGPLVFGLLGWWLDGQFGTAPSLAVLGGLMGFGGGLYLLIKQGMAANQPTRHGRRRSDSGSKGEGGDRP